MEPPITTAHQFDRVGVDLDRQLHDLIGLLWERYAGLKRGQYGGPSLLDAGCATGLIYERLPDPVPLRVTMLDLQPQYVKEAELRAKQRWPHIELKPMVADLRDPYLDIAPHNIALFTNTSGFMSIGEQIEVMKRLNSDHIIANFLFIEDNFLNNRLHPLTRTDMLLAVEDLKFTWDFGMLTGEPQPFSLQAIKYDDWRDAMFDAGLTVQREILYRDFKAERMCVITRRK